MKKLSFILTIIMLITLFPSCSVDDSKPDFEFSYEIEKIEYLRGENITIKATVMNISGQTLKTYLFFPSIELYLLNDNGEIGGKLDHQIMPQFEAVEQTVENGGIGSYTYVFKIPDDAACGEYSLKLWRGEDSQVFDNILRINAVTSQNENDEDEYRYSPISVSACGESVNPIRVGTSTEIQQADGLGAAGLFYDYSFSPEDLPALTLKATLFPTAPQV